MRGVAHADRQHRDLAVGAGLPLRIACLHLFGEAKAGFLMRLGPIILAVGVEAPLEAVLVFVVAEFVERNELGGIDLDRRRLFANGAGGAQADEVVLAILWLHDEQDIGADLEGLQTLLDVFALGLEELGLLGRNRVEVLVGRLERHGELVEIDGADLGATNAATFVLFGVGADADPDQHAGVVGEEQDRRPDRERFVLERVFDFQSGRAHDTRLRGHREREVLTVGRDDERALGRINFLDDPPARPVLSGQSPRQQDEGDQTGKTCGFHDG